VLAVLPGNPKALFRRAQALMEQHDFEGARRDVVLALEKEPDDPGLRRLLGEIKKKEADTLDLTP
ncbi:hypothetical protein T484DRAFT_1835327, partial [Baffinella frigidus]